MACRRNTWSQNLHNLQLLKLALLIVIPYTKQATGALNADNLLGKVQKNLFIGKYFQKRAKKLRREQVDTQRCQNGG